jgi:hypothetical protein
VGIEAQTILGKANWGFGGGAESRNNGEPSPGKST